LSDPAPALLLPPRPNLGPEPLPDSGLLPPHFIGVILAGLAAVLILVGRRRIRRRRSTRPHHAGGGAAPAGPPSARDRLIALSPSIRSALTRRFGSSCLAKTTEELASDDRIGEILGQPDFEHLIGILTAIDRLKFSVSARSDEDGSSVTEHLEAWELSVRRLTKALEIGRNGR
jgi:hypothetical protein